MCADFRRAEEVWCVRNCTERRVVRCRCSEYRHTGYWNMYSMVWLTIWQPAVKICHGQNSSSPCRNYSMCRKRWVTLKWLFLTIVRGVRKEGKREQGSVPEKNVVHSSYCGVVVSYDGVVFGIRGVEACLKLSVQSHGMRWTWFERRVSFDSIRAVPHWLLEQGCNVLCTRATGIRDRDISKYIYSDSTECLTERGTAPVVLCSTGKSGPSTHPGV
jgi:hypothetical protein